MTSDCETDEWKESIAEMNEHIDASSDDVASAIHYVSTGQSQQQLGQIYNVMDQNSFKESVMPEFPNIVSKFIRKPTGTFKSQTRTSVENPASSSPPNKRKRKRPSEGRAEWKFASYVEGIFVSDKWEEGQ